MANLEIPYKLTPAVGLYVRREQMQASIARGLPRLEPQPLNDETLTVACFGPSLRDTYRSIVGRPIISMSGATRWLAARGIVADYVLEMDPRKTQVTVCLPPVAGPTYLIASCVCSAFFDRVLAVGNDIRLWHAVSSTLAEETEWVNAHDPGGLVVWAGQTVGIAALHIGQLLGFRRFDIHGMDGSFAFDGARHAGEHGGVSQKIDTTWKVDGTTYLTSQIMANAVAETINVARNFPIETVWHGDGLTQALLRKFNFPNAKVVGTPENPSRLAAPLPVSENHDRH